MTETATGTAALRGMREDDFLDFVWIADPQISPDGTRVAFTRVAVDREADDYVTTLWIADVGAGTARALTSGLKDSQPRWSPDGRTLAFVRAPEPKKPGQIWLMPMDGGEARAITSLAKGASAPAWSPDGTRLAFLSATNPALDDPAKEDPKHEPARLVTRPIYRANNEGYIDERHLGHVWVIPAAGGEPRPLTHGAFTESSPAWTRDGKWVLFVSDRRAEPWFGHEEAVLYAVTPDLAQPTDGAEMRAAIEHRGAIQAYVPGPGGAIAAIGFLSDERFRTYQQADVMIADGAWPVTKVRALNPAKHYSVGEDVAGDQHPPRGGGAIPLAFGEGGRSVFARVAREGGAMLARFDVASGEAKELTPRDRDLVSGTATPDGRRWALVLGDVTTPGDLYTLDAASGALVRLWGPNDATLEAVGRGTVEEFWYPSFDGQKIHGWIVKPRDFDPAKKYPMVLQIHGGPHAAYGFGFFHEFHQLATAGYVVLYTNPRGSTSYGEPFAECIQYAYPGDDVKDLMLGVDELLKRGYVDEKRMGVTGGSGGGLLTNWIVSHSDRFAAAITQRCVSDWTGMYDSCDFPFFTPFWFRKPPYEDRAEWDARSPITFVRDIRTPLLILHSEDDWRTPIDQGESLFRALKQLGRPVAMVRFPGENHELSRSGLPSHRVQNQQHIRAWFDHFLQGKPAPQYGV